VYTGHESKYMLNSTMVPLKRSTVEKVVNRQVGNAMTNFLCLIASGIVRVIFFCLITVETTFSLKLMTVIFCLFFYF